MNQQALEKLRAGNASCPSDLDLDQLHQGELLAQVAARISEHVTGCTMCTARMESRKAGWQEIADVDPRSLLAGIRRRLDEEQVAQTQRSFWRRFAFILTPVVAAAAVLAIVVIGKRDTSSPTGDGDGLGVREKGGIALKVHRFANGQSQRVLSGERFVPGDRLRFVIDLPAAGNVNVLGVESSGNLYVAWPIGEGSSTLRPAGKDQELPGAVVLDNSAGRETMYLVHCPQSALVPSASCKTSGPGTPLACPPSCASTPFVLNKQQPAQP